MAAEETQTVRDRDVQVNMCMPVGMDYLAPMEDRTVDRVAKVRRSRHLKASRLAAGFVFGST